MEGVVIPSDMGMSSERAAKMNTLLRISGETQLIRPGMRMGLVGSKSFLGRCEWREMGFFR